MNPFIAGWIFAKVFYDGMLEFWQAIPNRGPREKREDD